LAYACIYCAHSLATCISYENCRNPAENSFSCRCYCRRISPNIVEMSLVISRSTHSFNPGKRSPCFFPGKVAGRRIESPTFQGLC
jgi:hypothetical protein